MQAKEAARHPWFREFPYPKAIADMPACPTVEPSGLGAMAARAAAAPSQSNAAVIGRIKHAKYVTTGSPPALCVDKHSHTVSSVHRPRISFG